MKTIPNPFLRFCLKIIAVLAFVYFTNPGFSDRLKLLIDDQNYPTIVVFIMLWIFSLFVLITTSLQQNLFTRIFWGLIISITTAISYGFFVAGGSELEVLDVFELWQAKHEAGRAVSHYLNPAVQGAVIALLGLIIICFSPPKVGRKSAKFLSLISWLPLIPLIAFSTLIFLKSDKAVAGLPQQFSPASMAIAISYKSYMYSIPERKSVQSPPRNQAKAKHLLYLVDESINPNYLFSSDNKYLKGFNDNKSKIADFGVAISGSNCSARSNAILRLGATHTNLIQSVKTNPSIWQYAKKAGFRTVYIDSQATSIIASKPNDYQNYMTSTEAAFIDSFHKVKNVPAPQLDFHLLELIKKELSSDIPTFIYANKNGAHFPYNDNYPDSEAIHQPALSKEQSKGFARLVDFYKDGQGFEVVINTYKNSVHWTVDMFFRQFFNDLNLDDIAVIYTADHGQHLEPSKTTHCTSGDGAPATEGLVPLMLMTSNSSLLSEFTAAAKTNHNNTDHFALFPTVLNLLGYSHADEMIKSYGPTLFDTLNDNKAAFNTGDILGVISTDTIWREVSQQERTLDYPR